MIVLRAVARSENTGGLIVLGGENVPSPPLVEIGLIDLPKAGPTSDILKIILIYSVKIVLP